MTMSRHSILAKHGGLALLVAVTFTVVGTRLASSASARLRSSDVDEVWAQEDAYWRYVKAGDVEKYRTLWNDGFRGWPCHDPHPATKAAIGNWVKEIRDGKIQFSYSLTREGASNVGGVVVVYYQTPMIWKYADGRVEGRNDLPRKFTHTWMKAGAKWQIIGGMCGADAPRS
jgi:hypothetical protein